MLASQRLRVGLTGGIGSGKSAVADRLAARGAAVIDADRIAHQLTAAGGAAMAAIRSQFGPGVIAADGALERARMRELVFADPGQRQQLQAILHPLISERMQLQAERETGPYLVLVVPLLVESLARWRGQIDRIAVVDCDPELQVQRVMTRSGLTRQQVLDIMACQADRQQRLAAADDRIINDSSIPFLLEQTDQLHQKYLHLSAGI